MSETNASEALEDVERIRSSTRELLDVTWFPFVLWGSLVLISAAFTQIGDGDAAIAIYWMLAAPIGVAATAVYYHRRESAIGLFDRNEPLYIAIAVTMVIGAMLAGALGEGTFAEVGPVYPIAAGLLAFATINRSALVAVTAFGLAAAATVLLITSPEDASLYAALSQGAIMLIAGAIARSAGSSGAAVTSSAAAPGR